MRTWHGVFYCPVSTYDFLEKLVAVSGTTAQFTLWTNNSITSSWKQDVKI